MITSFYALLAVMENGRSMTRLEILRCRLAQMFFLIGLRLYNIVMN